MTQEEKLDMLLRVTQRIADEVGEVRARLEVLEGSGQAGREPYRDPGWWETWRETLRPGELSPDKAGAGKGKRQ